MAELDVRGIVAAGDLHRPTEERAGRPRIVGDNSPVVDKWQRHRKPSEQRAAEQYKRKNATDLAIAARNQVLRSVSEHALEYPAPPPEVIAAGGGMSVHERIPFAFVVGRRNHDRDIGLPLDARDYVDGANGHVTSPKSSRVRN